MATDTCEIHFVNADRVREAEAGISPEGVLTALADTFRVLADPTRVKILQALSGTELCVCDLSALLSATPSAVSHQLRLLRACRLVRYRKDGKMVYYTLDDDHIRNLLSEGLRHVEEG